MPTNLSEVQRTMLNQVYAQVAPYVLKSLGLKAIITKGDNELRFHFKRRKTVVNIDIRYVYASDTYSAMAYEIKGTDVKEIYRNTDVYFDQFDAVFGDALQVK